MASLDPRARAILQGLQGYKPGTPIEEVKRRFKLKSVIKLASNENALGPSPKALAALRAASSQLNRYPDAAGSALKAKLASVLRVKPDMITLGNGSDELLVLALRAFVDPGDEVVVAEPTFLIYALQAKACGASVHVVPQRDHRYDLAAMKRAVTPQTKIVFIANPDNPTGTYVTKRELSQFLSGLPASVLVVMDEAYYEFVDAADYPQTIPLVNDAPVMVTRTFSKAYGLAGLRVGYAVANPNVIAALEAVREPFNVNSLAQAAALAALGDIAFLAKTRKVLGEGRRFVLKALDALRFRYVPSAANFVLIECGPRAPELAQALLEKGVIVREMSAWKLPGFLRVTIGTMPENRRFVQALKQCLSPSVKVKNKRGSK